MWLEVTNSFTLHMFIHSLAGHFLWPVGKVDIGVNEQVVDTAIMELEPGGD